MFIHIFHKVEHTVESAKIMLVYLHKAWPRSTIESYGSCLNGLKSKCLEVLLREQKSGIKNIGSTESPTEISRGNIKN